MTLQRLSGTINVITRKRRLIYLLTKRASIITLCLTQSVFSAINQLKMMGTRLMLTSSLQHPVAPSRISELKLTTKRHLIKQMHCLNMWTSNFEVVLTLKISSPIESFLLHFHKYWSRVGVTLIKQMIVRWLKLQKHRILHLP